MSLHPMWAAKPKIRWKVHVRNTNLDIEHPIDDLEVLGRGEDRKYMRPIKGSRRPTPNDWYGLDAGIRSQP